MLQNDGCQPPCQSYQASKQNDPEAQAEDPSSDCLWPQKVLLKSLVPQYLVCRRAAFGKDCSQILEPQREVMSSRSDGEMEE